MSAKFTCQKFFTKDTKITDFDAKVYDACLKIPKGKISTYKSLARVIGTPKAYRAVGSSLRRNPFAPQVPCHRVVASDFSLGGFFGSTDPRGDLLKKKVTLLKEEGVVVEAKKRGCLDLEQLDISTTVSNVKVASTCFYDFE